MVKVNRFSLMICLALMVLVSVAVLGCASEPTTQEIIDKSIIASSKVESLKFDLDMNVAMSGTMDDQPGNINLLAAGTGMVDVTNKQTQMSAKMDLDMAEKGKQTIPLDYYLVDGWMYMGVSIPFLGEQWIKAKMDEKSWDSQSQFSQYLDILKSAVEVKLVGTEDMDGQSCYVLEITPDISAMMNWLKAQPGMDQLQEIEQDDLDLSRFFKKVSLKEWIARDSYLLLKTEVSVLAEIDTEELGISAQNAGQLNMNMGVKARFHDYNQKVTINLPAEAEKAVEMAK